MVKKTILLLVALMASSGVWAAENVQEVASFESGQVQKNGSAVDGFWVIAAPDPQVGTTIVSSGSGGFGPATNDDVRVVQSASVDGETVLPRAGDHFMWHQIFFEKDYSAVPGNAYDVPRTDSSLGGGNKLKFDIEYWLGFSIYTPLNYERETNVSDHRGSSQLLTCYTTSRADETFFNFAIRPYPGSSFDHWHLNYYVNPQSVEEVGIIRTSLGSNKDDIGRWTDFVIRFRANPFSVDTNPAQNGIPGAADKLFRANKGILQVWKSFGTTVDANGDRPMRLVFSIEDAPVGNVPSKEDELLLSFRIYKYAWRNIPTVVKGPVWFGFDEIRFGSAIVNGTGYSDVHPSGMVCTDNCPAGLAPRPLPPIVVTP